MMLQVAVLRPGSSTPARGQVGDHVGGVAAVHAAGRGRSAGPGRRRAGPRRRSAALSVAGCAVPMFSVMPRSIVPRRRRAHPLAWPGRARAAGGARRRCAAAKSRRPGRVRAVRVAEHRRAPRLVQRGPGVDPVAERVEDQHRVVGEPVRGVADRPAARVLQLLRQIPVVQRHPRVDAVGRAARRRAGRRTPSPAGLTGPLPARAAPAARPPRSGTCPRPRSLISATSCGIRW